MYFFDIHHAPSLTTITTTNFFTNKQKKVIMLFWAQGTVSTENRIPLWKAFSSKTEEEHRQSDGPNLHHLGRWWTLSGTYVCCIFESDCVESMTDLLLKFSPFMDTCSVEPVCEDGMLIKCVKKTPFFENSDKLSKETKDVDELEDESKKTLFLVKWTIKNDNLIKKLNAFANMTDEDLKTPPSVNIIGRWLNLLGNRGMCVIESNCVEAVIDTLLPCSTMDDMITIEPVIKDDLFSKCVKKSTL